LAGSTHHEKSINQSINQSIYIAP